MMRISLVTLLIFVIFLVTSCKGETQRADEPTATASASLYEYRVGLGYGFLGKAVQVTIDNHEVFSIVGTEEIEQYAQRLGTEVLASGTSPKKDIIVRVIVDNEQPFEQVIDLSAGMFIHIYYERTGLRVYNTRFLVQE
jgi:biopolymer transport protein ExbD